MLITKRIGIWMDHSTANLMELTTNGIDVKTLSSEFTHLEKESSLVKSENLMHHKEQQEQASYYKKLSNVIRDYEDVLLFGPTEAKQELLNILRADHRFEKVKIHLLPAGKMTENQQHAFVREYFYKH